MRWHAPGLSAARLADSPRPSHDALTLKHCTVTAALIDECHEHWHDAWTKRSLEPGRGAPFDPPLDWTTGRCAAAAIPNRGPRRGNRQSAAHAIKVCTLIKRRFIVDGTHVPEVQIANGRLGAPGVPDSGPRGCTAAIRRAAVAAWRAAARSACIVRRRTGALRTLRLQRAARCATHGSLQVARGSLWQSRWLVGGLWLPYTPPARWPRDPRPLTSPLLPSRPSRRLAATAPWLRWPRCCRAASCCTGPMARGWHTQCL